MPLYLLLVRPNSWRPWEVEHQGLYSEVALMLYKKRNDIPRRQRLIVQAESDSSLDIAAAITKVSTSISFP